MNAAKPNWVVDRIRSKMNRKTKIQLNRRVNYLLCIVNLLLDLNRSFLCVCEP